MQDNHLAQSGSGAYRNINTLITNVLVDDAHVREQALGELKTILAEHHNIDTLPDFTRVALSRSISSYSITAKIAAQCLLKILSNSSATILNQQCQSIMHPIIAAFITATQTLQSTKSKDQLLKTTYLLKILSTMISKVGSGALLSLSDQIDGFQRCYRPIPEAAACQPPERIMIGQRPAPKHTHTPARLPHRHSDSETSSEGEGIIHSSSTPQAVQCRLDAMNCLRTIAETDSKALYPFWPRLLPACEYPHHHPYSLMNVIERDGQLVVRLRACSVIQKILQGSGSYMAIAEEKNSRVSFISLSAQLASMTIELHRRLGSLLKAPPVASDLTKEILKIAETLTIVSAYHRFSTPILESLLHPMVGLLTSADFEIKNHAMISLRVIFHHLSSISKATKLDISPLVDQSASIACAQLRSESHQFSIARWCDLLASGLPFLVWNETLVEKFQTLRHIFETISSNEEEARSKLSLLGSLTLFFPGSDFDGTYTDWVRARLRNDGFDSLDMIVNGKCERVLKHVATDLQVDLQNAWDDVRAMRFIGIVVSKSCISRPMELATKVAVHLLDYYDNLSSEDPDEKMISTNTWVMANCLELIKDSENEALSHPPLDAGFWRKMLKTTQELLAHGRASNSLKTNSVRITGVTVRKLLVMGEFRAPEVSATIDDAFSNLFELLDLALPKVQWNVATALRQILGVLVELDEPSDWKYVSEASDRICQELGRSLEHSSSFKVRIQVCLAFQAAPQRLSAPILHSIAAIKLRLDGQVEARQIPQKETEHALRLQLEIDRLLGGAMQTPETD